MYVPVKGGEQAIREAHAWLAERRRGPHHRPAVAIEQIADQLSLATHRVMNEGSLYDEALAALAIKQARGDLIEAAFLLRAFRTTLPRFGASVPLNTERMRVDRRVSATFKDVPGGQILGPTFDYTHRLLDFSLAAQADADTRDLSASTPTERHADDTLGRALSGADDGAAAAQGLANGWRPPVVPKVAQFLDAEGLLEPADGAQAGAQAGQATQTGGADDGDEVGDITREPMAFPTTRDRRLQRLARGDEGYLLALAYSTQRGYGRNHPFAGEIRTGDVRVGFVPEELGFEIEIADLTLTECEMVNQFLGSKDIAPQFTRGYGLVFGQCERKAMSMALVDRALRAEELGETDGDTAHGKGHAPAQDEEFVLSHCDNVEATGFVEHLKLPHYVDFQAELELIRTMRAAHDAAAPYSPSSPETEHVDNGATAPQSTGPADREASTGLPLSIAGQRANTGSQEAF